MAVKEKYLKIAKEIIDVTRKEVVVLECKQQETTRYNSKLGGLPYLPPGFEYPKDTESDQPLRFLLQINYEEMEQIKGFPTTGILQFYVSAEEDFGVDEDDLTNQKGFRVVYFETIEEKDESKLQNMPEIVEPEYSQNPVETECLLVGSKGEMPISETDYTFNELIKKYLVKYELDEKEEWKLIEVYREASNIEENIHYGGYSCFIEEREDPRSEEQNLPITLLQIATIYGPDGGWYVRWGENGFANFFISPEDLAAKKFDGVGFSWDTY